LRTRVPARERAAGLAPGHPAAQSRRSHDIGPAAAPRSVHGFAAAARPRLTMKAFARVRGPDLVGQGHVPRLTVTMVMVRTGIDVTTHTRAADLASVQLSEIAELTGSDPVDLRFLVSGRVAVSWD